MNNTATPILVEGWTDETFLLEVGSELAISKDQIEVCGGKSTLIQELKVISKYIDKVGVFVDLDERSREEELRSIYDSLSSVYSVEMTDCGHFKLDRGCTIIIGTAGLEHDEQIQGLDINDNEVEDHILKLLITEDEAVQRMSNSNISNSSELTDAVTEVRELLDEYSVSSNNGKFVLDIAKTTLKFEGSTSAFIEAIFGRLDIELQTHTATKDTYEFLKHIDDSN